jgi:hypothetical protein
MSRKDKWWIHRGALYQALGFMSGKIPLDHEEIRENVTIPLGISYERILENDGRHTGHYKYHGTHSFVGTVIIRAKVQRYTEKVSYYPRQVSRKAKVHDSTHRVFVRCPKCSKPVPFGRLHQHVDTKICVRDAHQS